uniref:Uncharacterized protein n=1 Tax=Romanomermis culicivorax TaxID=13658 RepID=A0A915I6C9_ROMCU
MRQSSAHQIGHFLKIISMTAINKNNQCKVNYSILAKIFSFYVSTRAGFNNLNSSVSTSTWKSGFSNNCLKRSSLNNVLAADCFCRRFCFLVDEDFDSPASS